MNFKKRQIRFPPKSTLVAIPPPVLISLLVYLGTLAATQTVYGMKFMTVRWVALGTLTLISFVYWLLGRIPEKGPADQRDHPAGVFFYLGATLLSVATAENVEYSGLRWLTQGMLILSCTVFLRGTFNPEKMGDLLFPLKIISIILLGVSFLFPAPRNMFDTIYFRGAMGDSNSFGHISAVCALVYLQGAITTRNKKWRILQIMVAATAIIMVIRSGSRSSLLSFMVGAILIIHYFDLGGRSLLSKALIFLFVAWIIATPSVHERFKGFIAKEQEEGTYIKIQRGGEEWIRYFKTGVSSAPVFATRERLWKECWEGFRKRPFLGWGFGATDDFEKEWTISATSIGLLKRDPTNDLLFILEGTGSIGFLAYLALVFSILRRAPTREQILMLRKTFGGAAGLTLLPWTAHGSTSKRPAQSRQTPDLPLMDEDHNILGGLGISRVCVHAQMYILSVSLFSLFLVDGSAFSAGSILSALFWVSAGAASLTRMGPDASERMKHPRLGGSEGEGSRDANGAD